MEVLTEHARRVLPPSISHRDAVLNIGNSCAITAAFGSKDALIAKLAEAGKDQFGSGWAWLVSKDGKLSIDKTSNAETPMAKGVNCLLTVDVWEHAYYLDYQNARPKYLEAVLGKIINWEFAAQNLARENNPVRAAAE
jgi:Fe-Mn family superoxide dismutase